MKLVGVVMVVVLVALSVSASSIQQHRDGLDVVSAVVGREQFFDAVPLPRRDEPIECPSTGRVVGANVLFDVSFRRLAPRMRLPPFLCACLDFLAVPSAEVRLLSDDGARGGCCAALDDAPNLASLAPAARLCT